MGRTPFITGVGQAPEHSLLQRSFIILAAAELELNPAQVKLRGWPAGMSASRGLCAEARDGQILVDSKVREAL